MLRIFLNDRKLIKVVGVFNYFLSQSVLGKNPMHFIMTSNFAARKFAALTFRHSPLVISAVLIFLTFKFMLWVQKLTTHPGSSNNTNILENWVFCLNNKLFKLSWNVIFFAFNRYDIRSHKNFRFIQFGFVGFNAPIYFTMSLKLVLNTLVDGAYLSVAHTHGLWQNLMIFFIFFFLFCTK